jgi:hypothetical protein
MVFILAAVRTRNLKSNSKVECEKNNHRKVNDSETGAPYQIRKSQRFAGLENWDCNVDINRLREDITEYIETSARKGGSRSVGVKAVKRTFEGNTQHCSGCSTHAK